MKKIDVIIPALNEEKTVGQVVQAAKESAIANQIIVVSDGSTDRTADVARKAGATVVENATPKGKGAAILSGLLQTNSEHILLLDADLKGLAPEHMHQLAEPVLQGSCDMNIGLRDKGFFLTPLQKHLPLISGERALKREILEKIRPDFLQGYMLETALNQYCKAHGYKIATTFLPKLSIVRKYQKVGIAAGLMGYGKMGIQLIRARVHIGVARIRGKF